MHYDQYGYPLVPSAWGAWQIVPGKSALEESFTARNFKHLAGEAYYPHRVDIRFFSTDGRRGIPKLLDETRLHISNIQVNGHVAIKPGDFIVHFKPGTYAVDWLNHHAVKMTGGWNSERRTIANLLYHPVNRRLNTPSWQLRRPQARLIPLRDP